MNPITATTLRRTLGWSASILLVGAWASRPVTPDDAPRVFAPGVISGPASDLSPAFSPDGRTVFFTRANADQSTILISQRSDSGWAEPQIAPFSGEWRDLEPTMSPDGSHLIFASNRPISDDGRPLDAYYNGAVQPQRGGNLWQVDRTSTGWSAPHRLPDVINSDSSIFSPSIAADGSLYFMRPTGQKTRFHLFRAQWADGHFAPPVALPVSAGEDIGDFDPAVAPDESFIVFSSARLPSKGTSLFISFRRDGNWTAPAFLGDTISAPGTNNIEARLGPDPSDLYFSSTRVIPTLPPHDRDGARRGLRDMAEWNNGLPNIWVVSIRELLAHPPAPLPPSVPASPDVQLSSQPAVVGPGTISTPAEEFKATISPDGRTLLYVVTDHEFHHMTIVQSERRDSGWRTPTVATFSGIWRDGDPAYAPDGKTLYFISNRPLPTDAPGLTRRDFNIWAVRLTSGHRWGEPVPLGPQINTDTSEFAPSVTASGVLYFSTGDHIYRAVKNGNGFDPPVPLQLAGGDPAIAPDESFIVFDADGPTAGDPDLFVSCRTPSGWGAPRRFAEPVSSAQEEGDPFIAADGRTLLYFSRRFTPTPVRTARSRRATYPEAEREGVSNIYNGSRNIYQVTLSGFTCAN